MNDSEDNAGEQGSAEVRTPRVLVAEWIYRGRQERPGGEDPRLFGEPAWDMLLDIYIHQAKGQSTSVTGACAGSHAPATTALRYIDLLCELGWVEKLPDSRDKRRSLLALTPDAKQRINAWLDQSLERLRQLWPALLH